MPETTTEQFLDALIIRLGEISTEGYCLAAREFHSVFKRLKLWELHRKARHCQEHPSTSSDLVATEGSTKDVSSKSALYNFGSTSTWKDARLRENSKELGFSPSDQFETQLQPTVISPSRFTQDRITATGIGSPFEPTASGEVRWEDITFDMDEANGFDMQMEDPGWFSYLYDHRQAHPTWLR